MGKTRRSCKKLVWSETKVTGGKNFSGKLPQPPSVNGPIRNMQRRELSFGGGNVTPNPTFYADQVVLAYGTPVEESNMAAMRPVVTSSTGAIDSVTALFDNDLTTKISSCS